MTHSIKNILQFIKSEPWAILPGKLEAIMEFLALRAEGRVLSAEEIRARVGEPSRGNGPTSRATDGVAVIPLVGIISQRASLIDDMSGPGGTTTEAFDRRFSQALGDESVSAIAIDVDSPGGSVSGVPQSAAKVFDARGKKPVIAVVNSMMASAAYWIGSAADEVVITPEGLAGSIGVYMIHHDYSGMDEQMGVKHQVIKAGKYKAEGADDGPLPEEAVQALQQIVDDTYDLFISAVAKHRNTTPASVRDGYGEGRVLVGKRAVAAGLADRVGTLEETIARLANPRSAARVGRRTDVARKKLQLAAEEPLA
jgi:signal peptide peptidase SppA